MYSLIHPVLAQAVIDTYTDRKRGVAIRVIVDRAQMKGGGSKVRELFDVGVPLFVYDTPSHMLHKKCSILDITLSFTARLIGPTTLWSVAASWSSTMMNDLVSQPSTTSKG